MRLTGLILVGLTLLVAVNGRAAGQQGSASAADNKSEDYSDLEGRALTDLVQERSKTSDTQRAKRLDRYLQEKAAPRTDEDMKFLEDELAQKQEFNRHRAITWLSNIRDPKLKPELIRLFNEKGTLVPPEKVKELATKPERTAEEHASQEVLGAIMLELATLNAREIIPRLREYANAEGGRDVHTPVGMFALQALARIKDEDFFGKDRRERLTRRHVDFDDPKTKPWLMDAMVNDSDRNVRLLAGEAWAQHAANPDDPADVDFAWKLIDTTDPHLPKLERAYRRGRGFDVIRNYTARGHYDRKVYQKAVAELRAKDGLNKVDAVQLIASFGTQAEFRDEALGVLNQALKNPDVAARGAAQMATGRLTGKHPHYEGEMSCDEHPLRFGNQNQPKRVQ